MLDYRLEHLLSWVPEIVEITKVSREPVYLLSIVQTLLPR